MTAEEVKRLLGLEPHPREGGWFVRTYEAEERVAQGSVGDGRYGGPRRTGTAIYYLLEAGSFSRMHRLQTDEIFHMYAGDAVEMLQLHEDGSGERLILGRDLVAGERPQVVVRRGVWQGARMLEGGAWALLGCTVSPGFEFEDYVDGDRALLLERWPAWRELLLALT